jgi:hypothetical protein
MEQHKTGNGWKPVLNIDCRRRGTTWVLNPLSPGSHPLELQITARASLGTVRFKRFPSDLKSLPRLRSQ